jgi:hypothetical protein
MLVPPVGANGVSMHALKWLQVKSNCGADSQNERLWNLMSPLQSVVVDLRVNLRDFYKDVLDPYH